jgi:hypothetical protein
MPSSLQNRAIGGILGLFGFFFHYHVHFNFKACFFGSS